MMEQFDWYSDGTLMDTITLGLNGNEGVLHIPQSSILESHHQM